MKASKETIIRTIVLCIALANQILTSTGHSVLPFDDESVSEIISLGFTIVTSLIAWWKNNSFTESAIIADRYMEKLKNDK